MKIDVTILSLEVNGMLENIDTIDDTFDIENMLHKHISNLCDKKREDIYSNK